MFFLGGCNQKQSSYKEQIDQDALAENTIKVKSEKKISKGQKLFILCAACHNLKKDEPHKVGPSLYGIFGKKAGTREGFKYTDELKSANIVWDKESLRAWLENPSGYIPGTSMAFVGINDKERQDVLLDYLMAETKEQ